MTRRVLFLVTLLAASAMPSVAPAQQADGTPPPVPLEESGSAIYGYLAFGALAGVGMMILCRSSRRS